MERMSSVTAEQVIGHSLRGKSTQSVLAKLDRFGMLIDDSAEGAKLRTFRNTFADRMHGAVLRSLDPGVTGQWNGSEISISPDAWSVAGRSVGEAIAQGDETARHEQYHRTHGHTEAIKTIEGVVHIGGEEFEEEEIVEAITVQNTGENYVCDMYRDYRRRFYAALSRSGQSASKGEAALNEYKDLTRIDDRNADVRMSA